ncbi:hypothetical protein EVAR_29185_1 [Eumeta japonica]|uniref:Uncharacterized protein n=1 Tax=Eumeta variegata TaxID=151549 RepID=A0A4C1VEJ1_EUMVA|nr:hypothetical protein EVAR_29185_1 [Eumeta japonica]
MDVDEAKEMCKDCTFRRSAVSAYPSGLRGPNSYSKKKKQCKAGASRFPMIPSSVSESMYRVHSNPISSLLKSSPCSSLADTRPLGTRALDDLAGVLDVSGCNIALPPRHADLKPPAPARRSDHVRGRRPNALS